MLLSYKRMVAPPPTTLTGGSIVRVPVTPHSARLTALRSSMLSSTGNTRPSGGWICTPTNSQGECVSG